MAIIQSAIASMAVAQWDKTRLVENEIQEGKRKGEGKDPGDSGGHRADRTGWAGYGEWKREWCQVFKFKQLDRWWCSLLKWEICGRWTNLGGEKNQESWICCVHFEIPKKTCK